MPSRRPVVWRRPRHWRLEPPDSQLVYEAELLAKFIQYTKNRVPSHMALRATSIQSLRDEGIFKPDRSQIDQRNAFLVCRGVVRVRASNTDPRLPDPPIPARPTHSYVDLDISDQERLSVVTIKGVKRPTAI